MTAKRQVHFIGIGGIGMSALARYYKAKEWSVSGSDLQDSKLLHELKKEGIKVYPHKLSKGKLGRVKLGHKKENIPRKCDLVIYNQAIPENNPEFKEAKKRGVRLISYPEAVGELTRKYKTIAIAGSHGKSTTTALMSLIAMNAGFDPTVIVGTRLNFSPKNLNEQARTGTNFRLGKGKWLVLEADEYGRAFHNYSPYATLITNIDKEHLDTYKTLAGVKKSFLKFISNIQDGGILVLNSRDKNLKSLERDIHPPIFTNIKRFKTTEGIEGFTLQINNINFNSKNGRVNKISNTKKLTVYWHGMNDHVRGMSSLGLLPSLLGEHNISNASGAYTLAKALGIPDQTIHHTLKNFSGTWRRLEFRGSKQFIIHNSLFIIHIYDDYAHHPTEIKASLSALREANSKFQILNSKQISNSNAKVIQNSSIPAFQHPPLICVFQPHQTKRLESLFDDFVNSFKDADVLIILPIYKVPGREKESRIKSHGSRKNSQKLAVAIQKKYPEKNVVYLKNPKRLSKLLVELNSKFLIHDSILVMMGAGDIIRYTDLLLKN